MSEHQTTVVCYSEWMTVLIVDSTMSCQSCVEHSITIWICFLDSEELIDYFVGIETPTGDDVIIYTDGETKAIWIVGASRFNVLTTRHCSRRAKA